jgi:hypothetical protein
MTGSIQVPRFPKRVPGDVWWFTAIVWSTAVGQHWDITWHTSIGRDDV